MNIGQEVIHEFIVPFVPKADRLALRLLCHHTSGATPPSVGVPGTRSCRSWNWWRWFLSKAIAYTDLNCYHRRRKSVVHALAASGDRSLIKTFFKSPFFQELMLHDSEATGGTCTGIAVAGDIKIAKFIRASVYNNWKQAAVEAAKQDDLPFLEWLAKVGELALLQCDDDARDAFSVAIGHRASMPTISWALECDEDELYAFHINCQAILCGIIGAGRLDILQALEDEGELYPTGCYNLMAKFAASCGKLPMLDWLTTPGRAWPPSPYVTSKAGKTIGGRFGGVCKYSAGYQTAFREVYQWWLAKGFPIREKTNLRLSHIIQGTFPPYRPLTSNPDAYFWIAGGVARQGDEDVGVRAHRDSLFLQG